MHRNPDIGYGEDIAAVMTITLAHLRGVPVQHRPRPLTPLEAKGYTPLPPLNRPAEFAQPTFAR